MSGLVTLEVPADVNPAGAVVVRWKAAEGEHVRRDEPVVELVIDKVDIELSAPIDGVISELTVPPGASVSGGQVLAAFLPSGSAPESRIPSVPPVDDTADGRVRVERLPAIRRRIAETMLHSLATTAQLTSVVAVDVTAMMDLRDRVKDQFSAEQGVGLSPLAFLARATCMALPRHPVVNASMGPDGTTATYHDYVNLGIAVDTPRGLMVVTIRDAQDLSVTELARAIGETAARAREGNLVPDDVRGATFTITNTGSNGTLIGTPILNPPQSAILATYAIQRLPRVLPDGYGNDAVVPRLVMNLALTYDHRLIDGADAGRFLADVRWAVEHHDLHSEL